MMLDCVLFDLDGLLIDSERLQFIASLGLRPGVKFTVTARQLFNGPITVELGTNRLIPGCRRTLPPNTSPPPAGAA